MGSTSGSTPPVSDPGKDLLKYIKGLEKALPTLQTLEGQYRPKFGEMNLGDVSASLFGTDKQPGVIGMGGQAITASQQQLDAARNAELGSAQGRAGGVMSLLGQIDPTTQRMVEQTGAMADARFQAAQGLNMQENRMAEQGARESFASRGRLNDTSSVAAEILGREEVMAAKRAEAVGMGQQASAMSSQFSSPALGVLLGAPVSSAMGQDYLSAGRQAIGQATPQMIDTGAGITLGQQQASNLASWQQSQSSAKSAQNAQYAQIASALAMAAMSYSDEKVKENVKRVGKTDDGLPIYTYNLIGSPKTQMGVMAQEVEKKKPKALGPKMNGIMTVDYSKI